MREPRTVSRDIFGALVPYGTPHELKAGETVYLTQSLGGSHTCVTEMGYMVRIDARDADAIGEKVDAAPTEEEIGERPLDQVVWDRLKTCYDPEIPVDIYELGLIYEININEGNDVLIKMTLTSPACPVAETLPVEVEQKIKNIPDVNNAKVEITFEPPWEKEMMSEEARMELGMW